MTIKFEPPSIIDKFLAIFGKKRAIYIPIDTQKYGYYYARRENIISAILRSKDSVLPKGWIYWDDNISFMDSIPNSDLPKFIGEYCRNIKSEVFKYLQQKEPDFLKSLNFPDCINCKVDTGYVKGLFGKKSIETDFISKDDKVVIEFKYIRSNNEHDIKNGLSQVIEYTWCKRASFAILVVIDAGNAKIRNWNEEERNFIKMFQNNSFKIKLTVVHIRIEEDKNEINYEII